MKKLFKNVFIIFVLIFVTATSVFAKRYNEERTVEDPKAWKEDFDLTDKKKGKYNVFVTADDEGGNTTIEGPHNVYVDPESDLPIASITNPRQYMHVPGNLNIVGTCVDDDAVDHVELILDEDSQPIIPKGKEFWSYFLDTTQMEEGPHKITVYGVDIKGLAGKKQTVTWHLDRHQPNLEITNFKMGAIVRGKITLSGSVADGNGIERLLYSLDGGETYTQVRTRPNKDGTICSFNIPIDTTKIDDGGTVCWFKTSDKQGSVGYATFLFFVQNEAPEVKIVSPRIDESVNGKFVISGYAKDAVGLYSLDWTFGKEAGAVKLIPGNPYWAVEFDMLNSPIKNQNFTIKATSKVGNVTSVTQKIIIDNESDKADVILQNPISGAVYEDIFVRGHAIDDDGVASVNFTIDDGAETVIETDGAFYKNVTESLENPLASGAHTLKIWAVDIHGVKGKLTTVPFNVYGEKPVFSNIRVNVANGDKVDTKYDAGMELNPEANATVKMTLTSTCGIKSLTYRFSGNEDIPLAAKSTKGDAEISIPVRNCDWGFCELNVKATDNYDRVTEQNLFFYLTDLTKSHGKPGVYFTDNYVNETGFLDISALVPCSAYFVGGKPISARFEPATNFANLSVVGNSIVLTPNKANGKSDKVCIVVKTDKGAEYRSNQFVLKGALTKPVVNFSQNEILDGFGNVDVSGSVTVSKSDKVPVKLQQISYRILSGAAVGEWNVISEGSENFNIALTSEDFAEGISVIEVMAKDDMGNTGANGVFVRKVSVPSEKVSPPRLVWIKGENYYYTCVYPNQLELISVKIAGKDVTSEYNEASCGVVSKQVIDNLMAQEGASLLTSGVNRDGSVGLEVTVRDIAGKDYTASASAKTNGKLYAYFESIESVAPSSEGAETSGVLSMPYSSGAEIVLPQQLKLIVKSAFPIASIKYGFNNEATTRQIKNAMQISDNEYSCLIPLTDLKADFNSVNVEATSSDGAMTKIKGTVSVVRNFPADKINNRETVYWPKNAINEKNYIVVESGSDFACYANLKSPIKASLNGAKSGVSVTTSEKDVILRFAKSGVYDGVSVTVTDSEGFSYTSSAASFIATENNVEKKQSLTITSPVNQSWTQNSVTLSCRYNGDVGVSKSEYSSDGGTLWFPFTDDKGASFSQKIDLTEFEDGAIPLDVRITDKIGNITENHCVVYKKTEEPKVELLVPCAGDIINGINTFVFRLHNMNTIKNAYFNDKNFNLASSRYVIATLGSDAMPLTDNMKFGFTDKAGNTTEFNEEEWLFTIDNASDKPILQIHTPSEGQVEVSDFSVSGVALDDDGECTIWYKVDNGEYKNLDGSKTSFEIPLEMKNLTDNEHTITVYAQDINGVKSDAVTRMFKISTEEPKGAITAPSFDKTVKGSILVSGWAKDANGIDKVMLSLDNGSTWNYCAGTENWTYEFDTRAIFDGTQAIFIKVFDKYGIECVYSNLINVDNTPPNLLLELPLDGEATTKMLFVSGQATDNLGISKLELHISGLDSKQVAVPQSLATVKMDIEEIVSKSIDLSPLSDGAYNVELMGTDFAGNVTRVSRNIMLNKKASAAKINILSPFNGESMHGMFNIYGLVEAEVPVETLVLYVDGKETDAANSSSAGYFKFTLSPSNLKSGNHKLQVRGLLKDSKIVVSNEVFVVYTMAGPWVTIDNFTMGDFAVNRPYLEGMSGYALTGTQVAKVRDKKTPKEERNEILNKSVDHIDISWDNGKTFETVGKTRKWRYRIENESLVGRYHFLIVRATMKNGEQVITRSIVQVDKEKPSVKLIQPIPGATYNENISVSGFANDDSKLKDVKVTFRQGDKTNYEIPSFIQGLYLDLHFLGATMYDVGLGLSFFQDNVKLQFQFGQMTQTQFDLLNNWGGYKTGNFRYGGNVYGFKILANVFNLPFKWFMGPDWDWLSASIIIGANFSIFSETQSNKPQVLSAVIAQLEFPRISLRNQKLFRTFALYVEYQLWFIPTDVKSTVGIASVINQVGVGIKVNVF